MQGSRFSLLCTWEEDLGTRRPNPLGVEDKQMIEGPRRALK